MYPHGLREQSRRNCAFSFFFFFFFFFFDNSTQDLVLRVLWLRCFFGSCAWFDFHVPSWRDGVGAPTAEIIF